MDKKLYQLTASKRPRGQDHYDIYNRAIVCARSEDEARYTHPNIEVRWNAEANEWQEKGLYRDEWYGDEHCHGWTRPEDVRVLELGNAHPFLHLGVVMVSFTNA